MKYTSLLKDAASEKPSRTLHNALLLKTVAAILMHGLDSKRSRIKYFLTEMSDEPC